ncbi:MAG: hypothetical protein Q4C70_01865 [Planctomycetia bacterium]|nr:hypothetical protein [Planctomycetia bacterium]
MKESPLKSVFHSISTHCVSAIMMSAILCPCAWGEDITVNADLNFNASNLGNSTDNYSTADGDTNFYNITVNPDINVDDASSYNGIFSGNINLIFNGSDNNRYHTLGITKAQSYEGTTTLNSGWFVLRGSATFGKGDIIIDGGLLHTGNYNAGSITIDNDFQLGTGNFQLGWSKQLTLTGSISDIDGKAGQLVIKGDSGTLILKPAEGKTHTYTGGTVLETSTSRLTLGADVTLVSKMTNNGVFNLNGNDATLRDISGSGIVKTSTGESTLTLGTGLAAGATVKTETQFTADEGTKLNLVKDWAGGTLSLGGTKNNVIDLTLTDGTLELNKMQETDAEGNATNPNAVKNLTLKTGTADNFATAKVTGTSQNQISGTLNMGNYAVFDLNGVSQTVSVLQSLDKGNAKGDKSDYFYASTNTNAKITNMNADATATLTVKGGTSYDGMITGNLNLVLANGGYYYLNNVNDFTGSLTVKDGTILVCADSAIPNTLIFDNGSIHNGNRTVTYDCPIQITENGGKVYAGWSQNITFNGVISNADGASGKLTLRGDSGAIIFGAENTYTGGTEFIDNGGSRTRVQLNADNALPTGGAVIFTGDVTHELNLNGKSVAVGALSGGSGETKQTTIKNGASTLSTFGVGSGITDVAQVSEYTGVFSGGNGRIMLEKVGKGTQIFSGGASTSVDATVKDGILVLGGSVSSGSVVDNVTVAGGTLRLAGTTTESGKLYSGTLTMTSGAIDAYGKDITVPTTVTAGTLTNTNVDDLSKYTIAASGQTTAVNFAGNSEIFVTGTGQFIHLNGDSSGNNFTGNIHLSFGDRSSLVYMQNPKIFDKATIYLNANMINQSNNPTYANNFVLEGENNNIRTGYGTDKVTTINGVISGDYALNINYGESNAGTVTLNAANMYTGGTNIHGSRGEGLAPVRLGNDLALSTGEVRIQGKNELVLDAQNSTRTIANAMKITDGKELKFSRRGENTARVMSSVTGAGSLTIGDGVIFAGTGNVKDFTLENGSTYELNLNDLKEQGIHDIMTVSGLFSVEEGSTIQFVADNLHALVDWEFNYIKTESSTENWDSIIDFDFSRAGAENLWLHTLNSTLGTLSINASAIPEPSTWALFLIAIVGLFRIPRKSGDRK